MKNAQTCLEKEAKINPLAKLVMNASLKNYMSRALGRYWSLRASRDIFDGAYRTGDTARSRVLYNFIGYPGTNTMPGVEIPKSLHAKDLIKFRDQVMANAPRYFTGKPELPNYAKTFADNLLPFLGAHNRAVYDRAQRLAAYRSYKNAAKDRLRDYIKDLHASTDGKRVPSAQKSLIGRYGRFHDAHEAKDTFLNSLGLGLRRSEFGGRTLFETAERLRLADSIRRIRALGFANEDARALSKPGNLGAIGTFRPKNPYNMSTHEANLEFSRDLQSRSDIPEGGMLNGGTAYRGGASQVVRVVPDVNKPAVAPPSSDYRAIDKSPYFETVTTPELREGATLRGLYIPNDKGQYTIQDISNDMRYGDLARGGDSLNKVLLWLNKDNIYASAYASQAPRWLTGSASHNQNQLFDKFAPIRPARAWKPAEGTIIERAYRPFGPGENNMLYGKYAWADNNIAMGHKGWRINKNVPEAHRAELYKMLNANALPATGNKALKVKGKDDWYFIDPSRKQSFEGTPAGIIHRYTEMPVGLW